MARIFKSNNYDKFRMHPANRNIDPSHLNTLLKSIKRHNLLHENPIKVKDEAERQFITESDRMLKNLSLIHI